MSELPDAAYAAALAGLDRMTVGRLGILLRDQSAAAAFEMVTGERAPTGLIRPLFDIDGLLAVWRHGAARRPPEQVWEDCARAEVTVVQRGDPGFPAVIRHDPVPAAVLFLRGSFDRVVGRRVGMVGTRNATASGREIATELGGELALAGVHIVSGLARGIDGCAHRGVLAVDGAAPVAVVASGLDVVYPREHARLWDQVAERGVLISEAPPGTPPETHRFPLRNRIIAGLSEVLVVVESRETGGSLITVREAQERSKLVMAVPGAVRNRAAKGTNDLIRNGCPVVTEVDDVLVALGLDTRETGAVEYDPRPRPDRRDVVVLELCCEPRTLDQLTLLTGLSLVECAMSVARLESRGWVQQVNGWFEALGANARSR